MQNCVIQISQSNYKIHAAGIEKFITDLNCLFSEYDIWNINIFPIQEFNKRCKSIFKDSMYGVNINESFFGIFKSKHLYEMLISFMRRNSLHYIGVEVHQLNGWDLQELGKLLKKLGLPVNIFIHDYEMICQDMITDDGNGSKCRSRIDVPSETRCGNCKYRLKNLTRYREISTFLLQINALISRVIAPSAIAGKNWIKVFRNLGNRLYIRPHFILKGSYKSKHEGKVKIAYLGSPKMHKGYSQWLQLISDINSNFEFYYFGNAEASPSGVTSIHVDFRDNNSLGMVEQLRIHEIDFAFLWSTCQETYCFTAHEAFAGGCILLTNESSGNIAEMVAAYNNGLIFQSLEDCIDFLREKGISRTYVNNFRSKIEFPLELKPNDDLDSLLFPSISDHISTDTVKASIRKSQVISAIYYLFRGKQYS